MRPKRRRQLSTAALKEILLDPINFGLQLAVGIRLLLDGSNRMHDGCVVATAEQFSNIRETFLGELFGQIHRYLPR